MKANNRVVDKHHRMDVSIFSAVHDISRTFGNGDP